MKLTNLHLQNFKNFEDNAFNFDGKSAIICGTNSTGKSAVLAAINYLCWNWLHQLNPAQSTFFKTLSAELVHLGASNLEISAGFTLGGKYLELRKAYTKAHSGKSAHVENNKKLYDNFVERYLSLYGEGTGNLPIFVNYGLSRFVQDISLRAHMNHEFSPWTALERTIEDTLDFHTFFEWIRNQEDYETEIIREQHNFDYRDSSLECVRKAIRVMLPGFENLRVRRNPDRLMIAKNGVEYNISQLSGGEKCLLALVGDLAYRIAVANPNLSNPLAGTGIVLIDEIELHMCPAWQQCILSALRKTFPNIQFIITTHSPQVMNEIDDDFKIFMLP